MVFQLVYSSRLVPGIHASDLMQISDVSVSENKAHNITGLMLSADERIVQILEGEKDEVERLFKHIQQDTRHIQITVLATAQTQRREFEGQAMVLKFIQKGQARELFDALVSGHLSLRDIAA